MRTVIIGVGAIGSVFLAFLTRKGEEVWGITKPGREKNKIRVKGIWGEFETAVETTSSPFGIPFTPELVIISVKSFDTLKALKTAQELVGEKTLILIAQNGYGNYEKAVEMFGEDRVLLARIIFGAEIVDEHTVNVTVCADDVVIGDPSGKIERERIERVVKLFKGAGIPSRYERHVYRLLWDKIIYNCALNPLGALLETTYGNLADTPYTKEIMDNIIEEIFRIMDIYGIEASYNKADEYKKVFYEKLVPTTRDHFPSMLKDIKRGKTEIDALNGAIYNMALRKNIPVPYNEIIVKLIKAKELLFLHNE